MTMNHEEDFRPPRATPDELEEDIPQPTLHTPVGIKSVAKDGNMLKTGIVSLLVTIVVIMGMSMIGGGSFVTKKDFEANWANMQASVATSTDNLNQLRTAVTNAVQSIPSSVNSQVSTSINQATNGLSQQISTLSSKIDNYNATVQSLQSDIQDMQDTLDDYDKRIKDLEDANSEIAGGNVAGNLPIVNSFSPTSGVVGTTVYIYGQYFTNTSSVKFGGVSAQSFTVYSDTNMTAVVGQGATGNLTVTTSVGTTTSSYSVFTYGTGSSSGTITGVTTSFTPPGAFSLPNQANISIANNSGKDIFSGQFSLTIQYLDATPSNANMVGLSSSEVTWGTTGSMSGVSVTVIGTAGGVFVMNGQTKIITVSITPPTSGTQFRITNVTYTGYIY